MDLGKADGYLGAKYELRIYLEPKWRDRICPALFQAAWKLNRGHFHPYKSLSSHDPCQPGIQWWFPFERHHIAADSSHQSHQPHNTFSIWNLQIYHQFTYWCTKPHFAWINLNWPKMFLYIPQSIFLDSHAHNHSISPGSNICYLALEEYPLASSLRSLTSGCWNQDLAILLEMVQWIGLELWIQHGLVPGFLRRWYHLICSLRYCGCNNDCWRRNQIF